jgi:hypothetical protein
MRKEAIFAPPKKCPTDVHIYRAVRTTPGVIPAQAGNHRSKFRMYDPIFMDSRLRGKDKIKTGEEFL